MKTLAEIKEDVAKAIDCKSWEDYKLSYKGISERTLERVSKLYASQFIDAAAETVELKDDYENPYREHDYAEHQWGCYGDGRDGNTLVFIDKDSILKLKDQLK